jgi:hypothetical protein
LARRDRPRLRPGYITIHKDVLRGNDPRVGTRVRALPPGVRGTFFLLLGEVDDRSGLLRSTVTMLAHDLGYKRVTLLEHLRALEAAGLIEWTRAVNGDSPSLIQVLDYGPICGWLPDAPSSGRPIAPDAHRTLTGRSPDGLRTADRPADLASPAESWGKNEENEENRGEEQGAPLPLAAGVKDSEQGPGLPLPPSSAGPPSPARDPVEADAERLCASLADKLEVAGSRRPTISPPWLSAARDLLAEGREVEEIEELMDWTQTDPWWMQRIVGPDAMVRLHRQFDEIRLGREAAFRKRRGMSRAAHAAIAAIGGD